MTSHHTSNLGRPWSHTRIITPPVALTPGARLGPYEITAAIGAGGMGEVYRATDTNLKRSVAIKVLPAALSGDPDRLARFQREAEVLAALNHPNIAAVYGLVDLPPEGGSYRGLVMELVEGEDLSEIIARGPVPLTEALPIAKQIADALEAAHAQGVIHRDLKPANIKVRADGTVKVLDFGLAKAMDPAGASSADAMNSPTLTGRATQMGMIIGTAAYMAPEQARGKAVDRRADIWAFGVVLFEMLAGQRAFKGDDVSDVLAAVLRQEIDWKALPAGTPRPIRRLLERCLERDPKRRLRDIGDAWLELDAPDEPAPAPSATTAPRTSRVGRALPWIAAVIVSSGAVAWSFVRVTKPAPQPIVRSSASLKEFAAIIDVSRDGSRMVYSTLGTPPAPNGITLRMLDQFTGKIIPGTEGLAFPLMSPDGAWVAFNGVNDLSLLMKVPITGGTPSRVCACSVQGGGAWGNDNTIVYSTNTGLNRVSADGGEPQPLTKIDTARREAGHVRPQFLPGGKQILFTVIGADGPKFAVTTIGTGTHTVVGRSGDRGMFVPSGHLLFVRDQTLFATPFDLSRLEVAGSEVPVVENISQVGPPGTADYAVSDTGTLAYFVGGGNLGTTALAWVDRAGTTKMISERARQNWGTGRLSPSGDFVANTLTDAKGLHDVWTFDVVRGTLTRLTFGAPGDEAELPIWSPDSKTVYYAGRAGGKTGLYAVPADASSRARLVLATQRRAIPTSVTPDGRTLLFTQRDGEKTRIFKITLGPDAAASKPEPLHDPAGAEGAAEISPDGRWVAYVSNESGADEIYVIPFAGPGAKTRISLDGGHAPRWSRDGRELLYWANIPATNLMSVAVTTSPTFRAAQPQKLFQQLAGTTWDTTRDPKRFLMELSSRQEGTTLNIVTNWFTELERRAPAKK